MKKLFALLLLLLISAGCASPSMPAEEPALPSVGEPAAADIPADIVKHAVSRGEFSLPELYEKEYPPRPESPYELPKSDPDRYYDIECYGFNAPERVNAAVSPGDGAEDKRIVMILPEENEFITAFVDGAARCAEHYGIKLTAWSADADLVVQNELINRAVECFPDAVVFMPIKGQSAARRLRRLNEAGLPVFCAGPVLERESLKYIVGWTGRDEWDQSRTLARALADKMNGAGNVAYFTLKPSADEYYPRLYGVLTELRGYAPDIHTVYIQSALNKTVLERKLAELLEKHGGNLSAVVLSDDSIQAQSAFEALHTATKTDILIASAGTSEKTAELVETGVVCCATAFSGFDYGAAVIERAALWFCG